MENAIKTLKETFIRKHGDLKLSKKHKFIGHERGRTDTHVIVGYSYTFFESAHTVRLQYLVPILEWDNPKLFVTLRDYVTSPPGDYFKDWFLGISYDISINAFSYTDEPGTPCKAESSSWRNSPYESDDLPRQNDDWIDDLMDESHKYPSEFANQ